MLSDQNIIRILICCLTALLIVNCAFQEAKYRIRYDAGGYVVQRQRFGFFWFDVKVDSAVYDVRRNRMGSMPLRFLSANTAQKWILEQLIVYQR